MECFFTHFKVGFDLFVCLLVCLVIFPVCCCGRLRYFERTLNYRIVVNAAGCNGRRDGEWP